MENIQPQASPSGVVVRFRAKNDRSGNPRRVYVLLSTEYGIIKTWDEGCGGCAVVPMEHREAARNAVTFDCSAALYNDLIKPVPPQ